jgi:predicted transcriptional regulator
MLTGETQLRARRTRIKILRAIADRNGIAGFSEIKVATGLSTGSIYYHLERMGSYVTKDSKHYLITEEGLQLLREVDPRYAGISAIPKKEQDQSPLDSPSTESSTSAEETSTQTRQWNLRKYTFLGLICAVAIFSIASLFTDWQALNIMAGMNANIITSIVVAATLSVSILMLRSSPTILGYKSTLFSVFVLAVVLASLLLVSGLEYSGAVTTSQSYDNSMDALLASYSMHWQIR